MRNAGPELAFSLYMASRPYRESTFFSDTLNKYKSLATERTSLNPQSRMVQATFSNCMAIMIEINANVRGTKSRFLGGKKNYSYTTLGKKRVKLDHGLFRG